MKIILLYTCRSARTFLHMATASIAAIALLSLLACRAAIAAEKAGSSHETASSVVGSPSPTAPNVASAPSATGAGAAGLQPKTASSGDDFTGDKLVLKSNMYEFTRLHGGSEGWIAMRGTIMRVTRPMTDVNNKDVLLVVVETVPCVVKKLEKKKQEKVKEKEKEKGAELDQEKEEFTAQRGWSHVGVGGLVSCPTDSNEVAKMVKAGEVYKITKEELENYGYYRSGWVYGALLVPYKYYFHDKSFASAATIGPYLGYRMGGLGFDTALVASLGLSSLAVANPNGNGDTSTIQGFSAAIGLIGGVSKNKNPLRFGLIVGRDWAGSNSAVPYKHEGKTWAAVQIGFSFSE